jgi:UDP-glucose 4-epimerase
MQIFQFLLIILICHGTVMAMDINEAHRDELPKKTVLVVGGAGYIGSQVNKMLHQQGYKRIILDNLSRGKKEAIVAGQLIEGDLSDINLLNSIFKNNTIDVVMHFAAFIDVGESFRNPAMYYNNNVSNTINLLQSMINNDVRFMVFSSTAAIFEPSENIAISENHPRAPISPYGHSKLMIEQILHDFDNAYYFKYCALRYFNAVGGDPEGQIKNFKTDESNLISVALKSLKTDDGSITIFGRDYPTYDGTCIRDYIHTNDLATAHILAMEHLLAGNKSSHYNLGNGTGYSVLEVLNTIEKVTGKHLNVIDGDRRPGDAPRVIADAQKAKMELGWQPKYSLEMMIEDAWNALP